MKKIVALGFLLFIGISPIRSQEWLTNFEEAKKMASDNNKHIVLVFAGSDWCAPCIKLEQQVLHTEEFQKYAKEKYVLVKADFPRKRKNQLSAKLQDQNKKLAEKYNKSGGFPLVVVLDNTGKKLGEVGYKKVSPNEYLNLLNSIMK